MPPRKRVAKRKERPGDHGGSEVVAGDGDDRKSNHIHLCSLAVVLQEHIASFLDHDGLFTSASVCKAWRSVVYGKGPTVMRGVLKRIIEANASIVQAEEGLCQLRIAREVGIPNKPWMFSPYFQWEVDPQDERDSPLYLLRAAWDLADMKRGLKIERHDNGDVRKRETIHERYWSASNVYKRMYQNSCYDCGRLRAVAQKDCLGEIKWPSMRHTGGALKVRLCSHCRAGYARSKPTQRLATGATAKDYYLLRQSDLAPLTYAIDTNPIDSSWVPMRLYRRSDLTQAALYRWGTREEWEAQLHKRRVGTL